MKTPTLILLVAIAIAASIMAISCEDESSCIKTARMNGVPEQQYQSTKFTILRQPEGLTCKDVCSSNRFALGMQHGERKCCCG